MFERSASFEENYFSVTLTTQPTNRTLFKIVYYEGTDTPTRGESENGVGIEVTIYDMDSTYRQIGYTASSYSETTLRHNRSLTEQLLAKIVRRPPTSIEQFLEYVISDAFATTRRRLPENVRDTVIEETITQLEVKGAFQTVDVDIWEEYNVNRHDSSAELFS